MQPTGDCTALLNTVPQAGVILVGINCTSIVAAADSPIAPLVTLSAPTQVIIHDNTGTAHSATVQPWTGPNWVQRLPDGSWPGFGLEQGARPLYLIFVRDQTKERYVSAFIDP